MQPLFALYRPAPSLEGVLTALAMQMAFISVIAMGFFVVARRRFLGRQIFTALAIGALLGAGAGLLIALLDYLGDPNSQNDFIPWHLFAYVQQHGSLHCALLGMFAGWIVLERYCVPTKPITDGNHGAWHEKRSAGEIILFGLGGLVGYSVALAYFTMPANFHSSTFWLTWQENLRWDWWLREQLLLSLPAAPSGMLASALLLPFLRSAFRRSSVPPSASTPPTDASPNPLAPESGPWTGGQQVDLPTARE